MADVALAYAYAEEDRPYELLNGEMVIMAPPAYWHIQIAGNVYNIFRKYLKGKRCIAMPDGMAVVADKNNIVIPDAMIVCDRKKIRHDGVHGAPDLVVEILSPSTRKNDLTKKMKLYERIGVREYWIISPKEKTVDVYILRDGKFELDNSYHPYEDWELQLMTEDEKKSVLLPLKVSLYDDFMVDVSDIFENSDIDELLAEEFDTTLR